jgi:MSHA pilin protein MshA
MKTQKGFTLIELIIVIVVLGILAVTAAPQFFNFSSDARAAAVQGLEASVKGASELVHAKSLINPGQASVDIGNGTVTVSDGYATANAAGILAALNLGSGEWGNATLSAAEATLAAVAGLDENDLIIYLTGTAPDFTDATTYGNTACYVYYSVVDAAGDPELPPQIGSVTDGCN